MSRQDAPICSLLAFIWMGLHPDLATFCGFLVIACLEARIGPTRLARIIMEILRSRWW